LRLITIPVTGDAGGMPNSRVRPNKRQRSPPPGRDRRPIP